MKLSEKSRGHIDRAVAGTEAIISNYAGKMETEAKQRSGEYWTDRSSHARQGLHSGMEKREGGYTVYLGHSVKYGKYLEEGTPPHMIKPKNKKALHWAGASHPVKEVKHPGTKPRPLLENTLTVNGYEMAYDILRLWEGGK